MRSIKKLRSGSSGQEQPSLQSIQCCVESWRAGREVCWRRMQQVSGQHMGKEIIEEDSRIANVLDLQRAPPDQSTHGKSTVILSGESLRQINDDDAAERSSHQISTRRLANTGNEKSAQLMRALRAIFHRESIL